MTQSRSPYLVADPTPELLAVAGRVRAVVTEQLSARLRADEDAGRPRLTLADQQQLTRQLLTRALDAEAQTALSAGRRVLELDDEEQITRDVMNSLYGLGGLQPLLDDPSVENINANGADNVHVRYADGSRAQVDPIAASDEDLVALIRTAAARLGLGERRFDQASPALNLRLPDGSRLFAVMEVAARPSVSIRRHRYQQLTLADEVRLGTLTPGAAEFLGAAVRARRNLIVAGATGAGKTTLLRALAAEIPLYERLVTVEDTLELGLDHDPARHPDVVALEARDANIEGEGAVNLADLLRWALRMSPDRVIVGEVRGPELLAMLNAMSMGTNGSMCTLHANGAHEVAGKLATYAIQAPERLPVEATNLLVAHALHLIVYLAHDPATGHRQVTEIREVVGADGAHLLTNEVYRITPGGQPVPVAPLRTQTMELLAVAGMDPQALDAGQGVAW